MQNRTDTTNLENTFSMAKACLFIRGKKRADLTAADDRAYLVQNGISWLK